MSDDVAELGKDFVEDLTFAQWRAKFLFRASLCVIAAWILTGYCLAYIFLNGLLTERELIVLTFCVAWTEAALEAGAIIYAWYQGAKVQPYTQRLAGVINGFSLLLRLMKPVLDPVMDGIRKFVMGQPKTPMEMKIEALEKENRMLREHIKHKKWFRGSRKPPRP